MITKYQAKYLAHDLTRLKPSNSIGKFAASLQDAQVDLNPHQVDAAMFAFQSPLSHGAILADEVGLGKTIEAGIILSQQWAEKKRRLLIIAPANLRKQWNQELIEKFYLPSVILESKSFNEEIKKGNLNPFNSEVGIVICSFQFAKAKEAYLAQTRWDLVVIDEAHRLRNVYKPSNKIANVLKNALSPYKKILLTATPLQNSILELYGLVSVIDDYVFGSLKSFKTQFSRLTEEGNYQELRNRLQPVCHRTLRSEVLEYINYTNRIAIVQEFTPNDDEQYLYDQLTQYLQRQRLYALPNSQRQLMTLILRKLLASSSVAICGTLDSLVVKLESILQDYSQVEDNLLAEMDIDYESADETADEWSEEEMEIGYQFTPEDLVNIATELEDLKNYRDLAYAIKSNSKAVQLSTALNKGFEALEELGANQKALIFTESRRTQDYLYQQLEENGYEGKVVLFNGTNSDAKSKIIYKAWLERHAETDKVTGSATADMRAALVDYFREEATIMVATEAAAEGINLQFCSLIVNYDMPWNPQRIEQRIGRCHRYGQQFDVVVVNFLNVNNQADVRVYELLNEKFQLFNGVFGASDEVLGVIGSGVDFEKRIASIYQECRTPEEIKGAFDQLQEDLKPQISERVLEVKQTLINHFDQEVVEKLRSNLIETTKTLNKFEADLWAITQYYLGDSAIFETDYSFTLKENPFKEERIYAGPYMILKTDDRGRKNIGNLPDDTNIYRVGHSLAQRILKACKEEETPTCEVVFDYTNTTGKISTLEEIVGQMGWMSVQLLEIDSFEKEEYLLVNAITDSGEKISQKDASRFFSLFANEGEKTEVSSLAVHQLKECLFHNKQEIINENALRNNEFFDKEMDKLDQWADDMKISLEKEIKDLDAFIKLKKSEAKKAFTLEQKVQLQREVKDLEKKRNECRRTLYSTQDEIEENKENLIDEIEKRLHQKIKETTLFTIRWKLI